ncbi:hypothetical protein MBLNU230_g3959t1 [Neophaeotheca triangularis]
MSVAGPSRRLAPRCLFQAQLPIRTLPQRRHASSDDDSAFPKKSNPILEEYQRRHGNSGNSTPQEAPQMPQGGQLPSNTIFDNTSKDITTTKQGPSNPFAATAAGQENDEPSQSPIPSRDPSASSRTLDPDPNSRERWERKKVIQTLRKNGRMSKPEIIARTEREHLSRSPNFKTSVKKLGMLARQIQGKTLEEALLQMRFSKKKAADEVRKHLEYARDEAIVSRGMGLGKLPTTTTAALGAPEQDQTREIQLKSGRRHTVTNPSEIYIDQAWVGRGPYGKLPDFRARGRVYIMYTPWTSLSVVLKEEKTRVRLFEEREAKRRRQREEKVWTPLPDRPIQGSQAGWYCW